MTDQLLHATLAGLALIEQALDCDPDERRREYRYRKGEGNGPDDRPDEREDGKILHMSDYR